MRVQSRAIAFGIQTSSRAPPDNTTSKRTVLSFFGKRQEVYDRRSVLSRDTDFGRDLDGEGDRVREGRERRGQRRGGGRDGGFGQGPATDLKSVASSVLLPARSGLPL